MLKVVQKFIQEQQQKWFPDKMLGIEWHVQAQNHQFFTVLLEKKGNSIHLIESYPAIKGFEALDQVIPKDIPIQLLIHTKGLLHRTLPQTSEKGKEEALFRQIFPDGQFSQFYLQVRNQTSNSIISVIRKKQLEEIIAQFIKYRQWVIGIDLGVFSTKRLYPILQLSSIQTAYHSIDFDELGNIINWEKKPIDTTPINYQLAEDQMAANLMASYASALGGLIKAKTSLIPKIEYIALEWKQFKLFKLARLGGIALLLIVLLGNLSAFFYYKNKVEEKSWQLMHHQNTLLQLDSLKQKYDLYQQLFQEAHLNQLSQVSFYADRIGATVPSGLQLTNFEIFPLKGSLKDYREEDILQYQKEKLSIQGLTENSKIYNQWINLLARLEWVGEVKHLAYKDISLKQGQFQLEIILKE